MNFKLNGREISVADFDPHTTLLAWLRQTGLTGSKEGCAEGECGACAVLLLRPDGAASRVESVNGCLLLLAGLADQEVWTVEGLAQDGQLHPAQQAMLQGGSQCGYCTPGFVVSMAAEYYRKDRVAFDLEALSGNLCRCTGYRPIKESAESLGEPSATDAVAMRLKQPAPVAKPFEVSAEAQFYRPTQLPELFRILQQHPRAKMVAGGTDWAVEINQRFATAPVQIAIDQLSELKLIDQTPEHIDIGAGVTLSEAEHALAGQIPLLHEWFPLFASRLIRNRATFGGNLGTASPIGDSPPVLLALEAKLLLASASGERSIELKDFFTGYRQTVLQPGEIIKAVRIPLPLAPMARFFKVAKRRMDDISTVAMAVALEQNPDGTVQKIRIGLGGVAATPVRAYQTEAALEGKPWNLENIRAAAKTIRGEFKPIDDHRGSAAYRVAMLGSLLEKFFVEEGVTA